MLLQNSINAMMSCPWSEGLWNGRIVVIVLSRRIFATIIRSVAALANDTRLLHRVKLRRDDIFRHAQQGVKKLLLGREGEYSEHSVLIPILDLLVLTLLSGMPGLLFRALHSMDEAAC